MNMKTAAKFKKKQDKPISSLAEFPKHSVNKFLINFYGNRFLKHLAILFSKVSNLIKKFRKMNRQYLLPFSIGILLILGPIVYLTIFKSESVQAWYDDNWNYRVKYTISNSGSADSDKKVKFDIDTAAIITDGKLQTDCGDSRFTDINGQILEYYLDTVGGACNTNSTDYYVLVPTINSGDTIIYHYYGNPYAPNGTNDSQFTQDTFSPTSLTSASSETGKGPVAYWKLDEGYDKKADTKIEQQIEIMNQEYSTFYATWYNESWTRRKLITATNNVASELTNYQIQLTLTY
ncbi:MAG: hypothetical protein UU80_C0043G0001, partial [candidate division WWE3 bacterium GW2011_GWA1_41_8]